MKTTLLPEYPDAKSPAGADIRFIMDGATGNMIYSTVPARQVNKAIVLVPGTSIDIPAGTAFQYRNVSDADLKFICIAMPPWPGDSEAAYVKGIWQPTI